MMDNSDPNDLIIGDVVYWEDQRHTIKGLVVDADRTRVRIRWELGSYLWLSRDNAKLLRKGFGELDL